MSEHVIHVLKGKQNMNENRLETLTATLERIAKTNSGATLENYISTHYTTGYQFSITENSETNKTDSIKKAAEMIQSLKGSCGVWYYEKHFYIETSYHTNSIIKAGIEAWKHKQISIYDWKRDAYIQVHA